MKSQPILHTLLPLLSIVALAVIIGSRGRPSTATIVTNYLIFVILVVALQAFVGHSGVFSFGHAAFMAIGAYTTGALRIPSLTKAALFPGLPGIQLSPTNAIVVGAIAAALVAAIIALPLMRLNGLVAGLATFGLLNIVFVVASNLNRYTGGSTGLSGVPGTTTPVIAGIWSGVVILGALVYRETSSCLRLRATREDEPASTALGINLMRERSIAFVLSAAMAGVAGGLYAQFVGTYGPGAFFLDTTFLMVAMLVVGGALSVSGAVIGATTITLVSEALRQSVRGFDIGEVALAMPRGTQELGVAAVLLGVLLLRPNGITGGKELTTRRLQRRGGRHDASEVDMAEDRASHEGFLDGR